MAGLRTLFALASVALVAAAGIAQDPTSARDDKAISRAKNALVSQLEPGMPKVTLDYYLRTEAGPTATIKWEANDCGEQTGNPADKPGDVPSCAEADVKTKDGADLTVMISVGTVKKGITGKPRVFSMSLTHNGETKAISRLSQIPLELHSGS